MTRVGNLARARNLTKVRNLARVSSLAGARFSRLGSKMLSRTLGRTLAVGTLMASVSGCQIPYYWQAVSGHMAIMGDRRPIEEVIADPATSPSLKAQLEALQEARAFALPLLGLENNKSYRSYVDLGRDAVTWNVFATPELTMDNKTWCFPVAGCVSYRGYFSKDRAERYAQQLDRQGLDTYVGGASAYSTLGWFADPVLNTFISPNALANAALLFHELAHQTLYLKGDSTFNESYATSLEQILVQRWLQAKDQMASWPEFLQHQQRKQDFTQLIVRHQQLRKALFESPLSDAEKHAAKQQQIAELRADYQTFKASWNQYPGYDQWMAKSLNNAQLSTVATYHQWVPAFWQLYRQLDENLPQFLAYCQELKDLPVGEREQRLQALMPPRV